MLFTTVKNLFCEESSSWNKLFFNLLLILENYLNILGISLFYIDIEEQYKYDIAKIWGNQSYRKKPLTIPYQDIAVIDPALP